MVCPLWLLLADSRAMRRSTCATSLARRASLRGRRQLQTGQVDTHASEGEGGSPSGFIEGAAAAANRPVCQSVVDSGEGRGSPRGGVRVSLISLHFTKTASA